MKNIKKIDILFLCVTNFLKFQRKTSPKMADNEQKAIQLIAEAEKKLTSSKGFFGSMFG